MRFTNWMSLPEAHEAAPEGSGLLQIRIRRGLITYPAGRSAMYYYAYGANVKQAVAAFRQAVLPKLEKSESDLLIRWMESEEAEERFRILLARFASKFCSIDGDQNGGPSV